MIRWGAIGWLALAAVTAMGCVGGTSTTTTVAKPQPSTFFNFCTNELIPAEFDEKYAVADPENGVKTDPDKLQVEHSYIYSSTAEECNRMMRKLYAKLRNLANDQHCKVSNVDAEGTNKLFNGFSFDYALDDRSGTVVVEVEVLEAAKEKTQPMRYRVEMTVTEKATREDTPAPK